MNYLIDTSGRWWRWPSELLAEQLGYPDADFDLAGYAARNLGYVWLEVREEVTLLQFRAGMLSPAVLRTLESYLDNAKTTPVGLVFYLMGWMEEVFLDAAAAAARLRELAGLREPRMRDKFIRAPQDLTNWRHSGQQRLVGLYELWRANGGRYDASVDRYLQSSELIDRTLLVEEHPQIGLTLKFSGDGFSIYDDFKLKQMVGRKLTDQPDPQYGQWTAQSYTECMKTGAPLADDIDAIIEAEGHDSRRRRYQRLILRWRDGNGGCFLSGSSLVTPHISVPLGQEGDRKVS